LNLLYNNKSKVIICGDININYLENCTKKQQLDSMLAIYNLIGTVHFPTKITNRSISAIDNICIDKTRNYSISPFIDGMTDHEAQVITLKNIFFTETSSL